MPDSVDSGDGTGLIGGRFVTTIRVRIPLSINLVGFSLFQFVLLVFLSFILEEVIVIFLIHILKKIKIFLSILKTDKCLCVFTYQFIDFFSILSSLLIIVLMFNCIEIVSKVSLMDADLDDSWLLHNQPIMILESTCWHHGVGFVFIALVAFDVSFIFFFTCVVLTHSYLYFQKA